VESILPELVAVMHGAPKLQTDDVLPSLPFDLKEKHFILIEKAGKPGMSARQVRELVCISSVARGLPYAFQRQTRLDEITGGSPYGTSTIAGGKGERMASENELAAARFQGRHVAQIAKKLSI
jgi:hypothetical protein